MSKTHLFDLDGKIAFVSGASRGIGEAIASCCWQQGAHDRLAASSKAASTWPTRSSPTARRPIACHR
jgi:NAD(P)-dependent dehydrogenase (short-subunit alcohol dehydrogenase family)